MARYDLCDEVLLQFQKEQFHHDRRNHSDILCLHKTDRLKHYGLHFCKYVGRLARGTHETKTASQTIVDALLVGLSTANTLHQRLQASPLESLECRDTLFLAFADAAGRFADACEKIDHLESFLPEALQANLDIVKCVLDYASLHNIEVSVHVAKRRAELSKRHFYVDDE